MKLCHLGASSAELAVVALSGRVDLAHQAILDGNLKVGPARIGCAGPLSSWRMT
jgi:hypothetical protein